jgi:hypothetical protein
MNESRKGPKLVPRVGAPPSVVPHPAARAIRSIYKPVSSTDEALLRPSFDLEVTTVGPSPLPMHASDSSVPSHAPFLPPGPDIRALTAAADQALATLHQVIRDLERRLQETAPQQQAPSTPAPAPPPVRSSSWRPSAIPPGPPPMPGPTETGISMRRRSAPDDVAWDGGKRRRKVAIALAFSILVGLGVLLAAMASSRIP